MKYKKLEKIRDNKILMLKIKSLIKVVNCNERRRKKEV